jgi:ATP-dependent Clp protease ATP-binding subunit ClpC
MDNHLIEINTNHPNFILSGLSLKLDKTPIFLKISFLLSIILFALGILLEKNIFVSGALFLFSIFLFGLNLNLFNYFKIKRYSPSYKPIQVNNVLAKGEHVDIGPALSFAAAKLLINSDSITTEKLLEKICHTPTVRFVLYKAGLNFHCFNGIALETNLENILRKAVEVAAKHSSDLIDVSDILYGVVASSPALEKLFFDYKLSLDDLENLIFWEKTLIKNQKDKTDLLNPEKWITTGGIASDWSSGYAVNLEKYAKDLTKIVAKGWVSFSVISRQELTDQIQTLLSKNHSNLVLIGEPGVGRKALVLDFAKKVLYGQTFKNLSHKRIMELDLGLLLAGADIEAGEVETRLKLVLNDAAKAGNIILLIDDIKAILIKKGVGTVDASQILIPYLESGSIQLIGIASMEEWHEIGSNSRIAPLFSRLIIPEANESQTMKILQDISFRFENKYDKNITYPALKEAYICSKKYLPYQALPAKAVDLLEESCIYAQNTGDNNISAQIIRKVISAKTNIPAEDSDEKEKEVLLKLEGFIHQRVIGQAEAVKAVSNALRRARAGLKKEGRPVATFLFLGPTGVGKTELSKALAKIYFGSTTNMIRLDMSEYGEKNSVSKLLGRDNDAGGYLTKPVKEKPFSLILLDEIEKAHPDILNLFLQVLDDGRLTDNLGRTIDFTHTIIIATSNAGSELIRREFSTGNYTNQEFSKILLDKIQSEGTFKPEFLNRFDGVITFGALKQEEVKEIAKLLIKDVAKALDEKGITLEITDQALEELVREGYDPVFGGRQMRRVIQDKLENFIAKKLLETNIESGETIVFDTRDLINSY